MPPDKETLFDNIIDRIKFVLPDSLKEISNSDLWTLLKISQNTYYQWKASKAHPDSDKIEYILELMEAWNVHPKYQIWVIKKRGGPPPAILRLRTTGGGARTDRSAGSLSGGKKQ